MKTRQSEGERSIKSKGASRPVGSPETAAAIHGALRQLSGFDISQLIGEFRAMRASVLALWRDAQSTSSARPAIEEIARFNEALDEALAKSVESYSSGVLAAIRLRDEGLRRAEEALRQAQKMEAVGQLTGGLAHDFNNLLAGISGSLEVIQRSIALGRMDNVERFLATAKGAVKRAAALTHRLLAFSRRQTLDPKPINVNHLIGDMEDLVRRTVGPSVHLEVLGDSGLWPTLVDPHQLENALLNLASMHATPCPTAAS